MEFPINKLVDFNTLKILKLIILNPAGLKALASDLIYSTNAKYTHIHTDIKVSHQSFKEIKHSIPDSM